MKLWLVALIGIGAAVFYLKNQQKPILTKSNNASTGGDQILNAATAWGNTLSNVTSIFNKMTPSAQTAPDSLDIGGTV